MMRSESVMAVSGGLNGTLVSKSEMAVSGGLNGTLVSKSEWSEWNTGE